MVSCGSATRLSPERASLCTYLARATIIQRRPPAAPESPKHELQAKLRKLSSQAAFNKNLRLLAQISLTTLEGVESFETP